MGSPLSSYEFQIASWLQMALCLLPSVFGFCLPSQISRPLPLEETASDNLISLSTYTTRGKMRGKRWGELLRHTTTSWWDWQLSLCPVSPVSPPIRQSCRREPPRSTALCFPSAVSNTDPQAARKMPNHCEQTLALCDEQMASRAHSYK